MTVAASIMSVMVYTYEYCGDLYRRPFAEHVMSFKNE